MGEMDLFEVEVSAISAWHAERMPLVTYRTW